MSLSIRSQDETHFENSLEEIMREVNDASRNEVFISRIMQDKATWEQFINNFPVSYKYRFMLSSGQVISKYIALLNELGENTELKKMIIDRLKEFDISLLHLACDDLSGNIPLGNCYGVSFVLAHGADPTWIPSGYNCNAMDYFLRLCFASRLPMSADQKNIIIDMLKAGIDPSTTHAALEIVLPSTLNLFPASCVTLFELGVLPGNQYIFMQGHKAFLARMATAKQPQTVDKDLLLSFMIYFNWHAVSPLFNGVIKLLHLMPDVKTYLEKKEITCVNDLAKYNITELKNDLRKFFSSYHNTRNNLLTVCLMYARYHQVKDKHYYFSFLPKDVFVNLLYLLDPKVTKKECYELLNFCIANRETYLRLLGMGTICVYGTKAMFVSAQSLAIEYEKLKKNADDQALLTYCEKAKPHLLAHYSLFRLPAHAAALKNSLQDSDLIRDCVTMQPHDRP